MRSTTLTPTLRAAVLAGAFLLGSALTLAAQREPAPASPHLPADVLTLACAPSLTYEEPVAPVRIVGGQDTARNKRVWAPGDLVTVNVGRENGVRVGEEFFVRRTQLGRGARISARTPASVRTAGWVKIYAVEERMSLATVTHACDSIEVGDYLEPFQAPTIPTPAAGRPKPERDNYGRVLIGSDRRMSFGSGEFFTIDRGKNHGIEPGSAFVVYRDKKQGGNFLVEIAEAMAVDVREDSATLTVTLARDAIAVDDYVAMRRPLPDTNR
jgi:hypothetical protein